MLFSEKKAITLLNGLVLQDKDGEFPPLQEVSEIEHACNICPVRPLCQDNNEFDCQVYGMFQGYYAGIDDALKFFETHTVTPSNNHLKADNGDSPAEMGESRPEGGTTQ